MSDGIIRHTIKAHWPGRGIRWPVCLNSRGKAFKDPLPGQSSWIKKIKKALDEHPDAPQVFNKKKEWIDACFAQLIRAAVNRCPLLGGLTPFEMFSVVKPEVGWAKDLSVNCITNLFMAILMGRGEWKLHTKRPDDEVCLSAKTMDCFQEMLKLVGQVTDIEICMNAPDGTIVTLDNGGVSGFIERGLLHPENQIISAELSEGLHRLTVSSAPQEDDTGLADALDGIIIGHTPDEEEANTNEEGPNPSEEA